MRCENRLCIYEENGCCFYNKVVISKAGVCKNCTLPKIEEKMLAEIKLKTMKELCIK